MYGLKFIWHCKAHLGIRKMRYRNKLYIIIIIIIIIIYYSFPGSRFSAFLKRQTLGKRPGNLSSAFAIPTLFSTTSKIAQNEDNLEPIEVLIDGKENASFIICRLTIETIDE